MYRSNLWLKDPVWVRSLFLGIFASLLCSLPLPTASLPPQLRRSSASPGFTLTLLSASSEDGCAEVPFRLDQRQM